MKWYEKIGAWLQKYWGIVVGAVVAVVSFLMGRYSLRGTIADYQRLRDDFTELQELLDRNKTELAYLGKLNTESKLIIESLERELDKARAEIDHIGNNIERHDSTRRQLDEAIGRLRGFAEKYRTTLEHLQDDDDSNN